MKKVVILLALIAIVLVGCVANDSVVEDMDNVIQEQTNEIDKFKMKIDELTVTNHLFEEKLADANEIIDSFSCEGTLMSTAFEIVQLLKDEDWMGLSSYVHPTVGVRITPYQYVDAINDQVFTASQINTILASSLIYNWGIFDGTGEPIDMNFMQYYNRFIYDQDFINAPVVGNNSVVSYGNIINNIEMIYPTGDFVEFYFPQFDPQYEGMDWRSLTIVLENSGGTWYLIGIIHGEWTI